MKKTLKEIFDALRTKNYRVVAPVRDGNKIFFTEVSSPDEITLDYVNSEIAAKEWLFPRTEVVMKFDNLATENVEISDDIENQTVETLTAIIGVRPCDVKSLLILDKVFSWDYKDAFYLNRRENTVLVTLGCSKLGDGCFCDKVALDMSSQEGSDVFLAQNGDGSFEMSVVSDKGAEIFPGEKIVPEEQKTTGDAFDKKKIKAWLDGNFEDEIWDKMALKCLSCGACAYVCPTCHCFDVIDEASISEGCRRKNWDSCGFGQFTIHASGHNPRPSQKERFRNRILHKFKYYVDKFDETACVGCGRCRKVCPVNMNLRDIVGAIEKK